MGQGAGYWATAAGTRRVRRRPEAWLVALLVALLMLVPGKAWAQADAPVVTSFEQQDLDGDGTPDRAIILADYAGRSFTIEVYDQGQDMAWSEEWQAGTDFVDDVWLFQSGAASQTKLVIRFTHGPAGYSAELYDDFDGDGRVSFEIEGAKQIKISESTTPTAQIVAQQPWVRADGSANHIVTISAWRPVRNMLSAIGLDIGVMPQAGSLAWQEEVVGVDGTGIPDYEVLQLFPDIPDEWEVYRTFLNVNRNHEPGPDFTGFLFWPYLGHADSEWVPGDLERVPGNLLLPPIQMDWESGRILGIANFLPAWSAGDRWLFLSMTPLKKDSVNALDFERFAQYNFSGSSTPDMFFRLVRRGPSETVRVSSRILYPQQVGFSWHQRNLGTLQWDYKLELAGLYELPQTLVPFKDFALREVPFEDLLSWFTAQPCGFATFVAAEENLYASNEGIWEWDTLEGVVSDVSNGLATIPGSRQAQRAYILGKSDTSPAGYYTDIRTGFRAEYGDLAALAQLYFSPIDRKLHLQGAQKGIWNLGDGREIRYQSLGGEYIDHWTLLENGRSTKTLYHAAPFLVYQDAAGIQLVQADVPDSLFTALPPRNHDEWAQLGKSLEAGKPTFAPDDFAAMVRQFVGAQYSVESASLRDLRAAKDGFRFVLQLRPGHHSEGADWLDVDGLEPGEYLVEYDGHFTILPLTPPDLRLAPLDQAPPEYVASSAGEIGVAVQNLGLADANEVLLQVGTSEPGVAPTAPMTRSVSILSGERSAVRFQWAPSAAGDWTVSVHARALGDDGREVAEAATAWNVVVQPAEGPPLSEAASAFGAVEPIWLAPLLAAVVLAGSAVLLAALRGSRKEPVPRDDAPLEEGG